MQLNPISLAVLNAYGLANPPRPMWLGSRATLAAYMRSGGVRRGTSERGKK